MERRPGGLHQGASRPTGKRRDIFRLGHGPAVIVIGEIPGITPKVAEFGRKVAAAGCTAVLPHLFGDRGGRAVGRRHAQVDRPRLHLPGVRRPWPSRRPARSPCGCGRWPRTSTSGAGARGWAWSGMCFTGGFALAMMVDDTVVAPVLSQPSLPFPLSKRHKADIGISDADLARVKARTATGPACSVCGSPATHSASPSASSTLRRELGDGFIAVELDSSAGNPYGHPKKAHSVLTEHLDDREGTPTRAALDQILDLLPGEARGGVRPGPRPGRSLVRPGPGRLP